MRTQTAYTIAASSIFTLGCKFAEPGHCFDGSHLPGFDPAECATSTASIADASTGTVPTTGTVNGSTDFDATTSTTCTTDCLCTPGETKPCGNNIGECVEGIQVCDPNSVWGSCVGGVLPIDEICDGLDNDCNDEVDDLQGATCECSEGDTQDCGTEVGACTVGTQTCVQGSWGECSGISPSTETCDGIDNNCNNSTDEGLLNACGTCGPAPQEVCDGEDNDCDNSYDEGVKNACGTCGPVPTEVCDCVDNDCDNSIDEGVSTNCGMGVTEGSFLLTQNTSKQVVVGKPSGFAQHTPFVLIDEYDGTGDADFAYTSNCTSSQTSYTCTISTSRCDNASCFIRGRVAVVGIGSNGDLAYSGGTWQVTNGQQNKFLGTLTVDSGPSIVIASPWAYETSNDDDFSFQIAVGQNGPASWNVEGSATGGDGGNSYIKVQASVLRLPCSAESFKVEQSVSAGSTAKILWQGHTNAIPLIAVEDYNAGSEDHLYWSIKCSPENGAQACYLSAKNGNGPTIKFRGYLIDP
jgi:hypothetical protein